MAFLKSTQDATPGNLRAGSCGPDEPLLAGLGRDAVDRGAVDRDAVDRDAVGASSADADADAVPARPAGAGRLAEVMRGPGVLAVAGMVVNGGSLLMNLVLARVLDAAAYGAVVIQTSIFLILSMAGSALQMGVVHRESATEHGDSRRLRWSWVRRLRGSCALGVVVAGVVALVVCRPVAAMLSYPHPLAIAEAVVGAAVWVSLSVERGLLQARGAYGSLAGNLAFESCVRIGAVIGFVGIGLGVNGAGLGLLVGLLAGTEHARRAAARAPHRLAAAGGAGVGVGTLPAQRAPVAADPDRGRDASGRATPGGDERGGDAPGGDELDPGAPSRAQQLPDRDPFATTGPIPVISARARPGLRANTTAALAALVPLALLQNMDVVIVGWLNPPEAGAYAAISTACKVPVFIGVAVANFLLPEAVRRLRDGAATRSVLVVALAFVVAPGLLFTAAGMVRAEWLLTLVFGAHLSAGAPAMWVLSLAMTSLAVTLMFTTYLLGAGVRHVVGVLAAGTVVTAVGLVAAGGGLVATAAAGLAGQAVTALLAGVTVLVLHRSSAVRR